MKVLMIGTPICPVCKKIAPELEKYCMEHHIEYNYIMLNDAPKDILNILTTAEVKQAPAFVIIDRDDTITVTTGESIFSELDRMKY